MLNFNKLKTLSQKELKSWYWSFWGGGLKNIIFKFCVIAFSQNCVLMMLCLFLAWALIMMDGSEGRSVTPAMVI